MGLLLTSKGKDLELTTFAHGPVFVHVEWDKKGDGEFEMRVRLRKAEPGDMKLSLAFGLASRAFWMLYCEADLEERLKEAFDGLGKP